MDNENYLISIIGTQKYDDDVGEVKVNTLGSYTTREGKRYISYKEYDEHNPAKFQTAILEIDGQNRLTMMKSGSYTKLILEKGKRHNCVYDTEYGTMNLGVFTSILKNNLTDTGGKLEVDYTLDIDASLASKNKLLIEVTKDLSSTVI